MIAAAYPKPEQKSCGPDLPAHDCDMLYGVAMIARWLGLTRSQVKPFIEDGTIPTFRPPGRAVRCALKSRLNATFRDWSNRRSSYE